MQESGETVLYIMNKNVNDCKRSWPKK